MALKPGDLVLFTSLMKTGEVGVAEWGFREGIILKIEPAGELGARAMDCSMDTLIHWVTSEGTLYPKFEEELVPSGDMEEELKKKLLTRRSKC